MIATDGENIERTRTWRFHGGGSAAPGAERLCLSDGTPNDKAARLSLATSHIRTLSGKAERYRTDRGTAASI